MTIFNIMGHCHITLVHAKEMRKNLPVSLLFVNGCKEQIHLEMIDLSTRDQCCGRGDFRDQRFVVVL